MVLTVERHLQIAIVYEKLSANESATLESRIFAGQEPEICIRGTGCW